MSNHSNKEDTSNHFHIFVGDLSQEVDDATLFQAFEHFSNCSEARVMWDMKTGRTRGYGFVAFRAYDAAMKAISDMDGEWLGSRQIRVNWANQKGQPSINQRGTMNGMGLSAVPTTPYAAREGGDINEGYRDAWNKGANTNSTTVYVGNLTPFTTNNDLFPLFANYGPIKEIRYQSDRGYAFIKYETKEQAALAISQMNNYVFNGRALKTSVSKSKSNAGEKRWAKITKWGKDRTNSGQRGAAGATAGAPPPASPYVHDGGYVGGYPPSAGPGSAVPPTPGSYYPPPGNPAMSPAVPTPGGYSYTPQHGQYGSPGAHSGGPPSYPMPGSAGGYARNDYQTGQWSGSPAGYGAANYNQSNYGGQYSGGGYQQGSYGGQNYNGQYNQGYNH
jgi:nucleolysin TIA-1/TIAR